MELRDILNNTVTAAKLRDFMEGWDHHDLTSYDRGGFQLIDPKDPQLLYQCQQCFSVIFPMTIKPFPPVDPFEHHRKNCYGWNRPT